MAKKIDYTPYIIGAIALYFAPTIADLFASGSQAQNAKIIAKEKEKNTKDIVKVYKDPKGKVIEQKKQKIDLKHIATVINDSFYSNDWFGFSEDEDRAIAAILNVPKEYIPELAGIYKTTFKKDLANDFVRFLNNADYSKVAKLFN